MSGLGPTDPDALDGVHFPVDMDAVAAAAVAGAPTFPYELEFNCQGEPFNWSGKAPSKGMAELMAVAELSSKFPGFKRYKARLVRCVEG